MCIYKGTGSGMVRENTRQEGRWMNEMGGWGDARDNVSSVVVRR